jgi:hypothetical protein
MYVVEISPPSEFLSEYRPTLGRDSNSISGRNVAGKGSAKWFTTVPNWSYLVWGWWVPVRFVTPGWHFCIVTPQKLFPSPQVVRVFLTSFEFRESLEVSTPDDCAVCSKQAFLVKRGGYSSELTASAIPDLEGSSSPLEHRTLDFGSVLASNTVLQT